MKFAVEGAQRMHTLVNDILAYSKINTDSSLACVIPGNLCDRGPKKLGCDFKGKPGGDSFWDYSLRGSPG